MTDLILAELHLHLLHGFGPAVARQYLETIKSDPLVTGHFRVAGFQTLPATTR